MGGRFRIKHDVTVEKKQDKQDDNVFFSVHFLPRYIYIFFSWGLDASGWFEGKREAGIRLCVSEFCLFFLAKTVVTYLLLLQGRRGQIGVKELWCFILAAFQCHGFRWMIELRLWSVCNFLRLKTWIIQCVCMCISISPPVLCIYSYICIYQNLNKYVLIF